MGVDLVFKLCSYVKCKKTKKREIEPLDVFKDDILYAILSIDEQFDYYVSNENYKKEPLSPEINARYFVPEEIEVPVDLPEKHLKWFKERYKKEISILSNLYGKNNVEVKYGILFDVC